MTSIATQDGAGDIATKLVESADIVILGAGYGGLHVAQRLARLLRGERKADGAQVVRTDAAPRVADWREGVVTAYQAARKQEIDTMRRTMAERLRLLIGQTIRPESVYVDPAARMATVRVDGVLFHGRREDVRLVRPCAHCGSGLFESPPLYAPADVGYALSPWMPAHPNCEAEDSPYWLDAEL